MLAGIRRRSGPRVFQLSLIPPSLLPQRESRALLSPTPVILAAAGIQSPFVPYSRHSRRSGNPEPFCPLLPSFSPQRESRASPQRESRAPFVPYSRHSRRSGNPEPFLSPTPVILAEAGIQSPFVPHSRHSRRSGNPEPFCPPLPSFSPKRESRALLSPTPVILAEAGIQCPFVPYSRHSRRSGNPVPFSCVVKVVLTWTSRVWDASPSFPLRLE